jgi:hypothetical protein
MYRFAINTYRDIMGKEVLEQGNNPRLGVPKRYIYMINPTETVVR